MTTENRTADLDDIPAEYLTEPDFEPEPAPLDLPSIAAIAAVAAVAVLVVAGLGFLAGRAGSDQAPPELERTEDTSLVQAPAWVTTLEPSEAPATSIEPHTVTEAPLPPATSQQSATALVPLEIGSTVWPEGQVFAVIGPEADGTIRILAPALTPHAAATVAADDVALADNTWAVHVDRAAGVATATEAGEVRWVEPVTVGPACQDLPGGLYYLDAGALERPARVARVAGWNGLGIHADTIPLGCFAIAEQAAEVWAESLPPGALVVVD